MSKHILIWRPELPVRVELRQRRGPPIHPSTDQFVEVVRHAHSWNRFRLVFTAIAVAYWMVPAGSLPTFFPV